MPCRCCVFAGLPVVGGMLHIHPICGLKLQAPQACLDSNSLCSSAAVCPAAACTAAVWPAPATSSWGAGRHWQRCCKDCSNCAGGAWARQRGGPVSWLHPSGEQRWTYRSYTAAPPRSQTQRRVCTVRTVQSCMLLYHARPCLRAQRTTARATPVSCTLHALQMLSAPLFCLLAATAEAAEARQVTSALRAAPPQVLVRSWAQRFSGTSAGTTGQGAAAGGMSAPASAHAPAAVQHNMAAMGGAPGASAELAQAVATSVAAFSPQLSVPLTLGLQYTNSGVLTALCLFWAAVLWPR